MKNLILVILLLAFISCTKEESIKQYKIDLLNGNGSIYGSGTTGIRTFEAISTYKRFNKNNYHDCKSILFIGSLKANIDSKNYTNTDTCYLELFNITDASIITKSTICTNSAIPVWVESENILDYFPNKDIDLTVRIRNSKNGSVAGAYSASLYINF